MTQHIKRQSVQALRTSKPRWAGTPSRSERQGAGRLLVTRVLSMKSDMPWFAPGTFGAAPHCDRREIDV